MGREWLELDHEDLWRAETVIKQGIMHTPLKKDSSSFRTRLQVPPGTTIDFGFLFTTPLGSNPNEPIWKGMEMKISIC